MTEDERDLLKALEEQSRYYETLIEVSPIAIITGDPDLIVTSWNPGAERLFDWRVFFEGTRLATGDSGDITVQGSVVDGGIVSVAAKARDRQTGQFCRVGPEQPGIG